MILLANCIPTAHFAFWIVWKWKIQLFIVSRRLLQLTTKTYGIVGIILWIWIIN